MTQGKNPHEIHAKVERNILLVAEILGSSEFCAYVLFIEIEYVTTFLRKAKPIDVANFFNNVESIWDHLVKKNKCYKLDSLTEYLAEAGAADKV